MTNPKISHDSETPAKGQQVITATAFIWHKSKKEYGPEIEAIRKGFGKINFGK